MVRVLDAQINLLWDGDFGKKRLALRFKTVLTASIQRS